MPSIVRTSAPSAWTASIVQDLALRPSTWTVQAPQLLVSQPICVPVSPKTSRSTWTRRRRGSTSASRASPLTVMETCWVVIGASSRERQRALERPVQRSNGQLGDHRPLVLGGPAKVARGFAHRRGRFRRRPDRFLGGLPAGEGRLRGGGGKR